MADLRRARPLPDLASSHDIRSVLVVRLKALGDIVLSLPIVYALRERFPDARIRYLCRARYSQALSSVCELDEVLELPEDAARTVLFALELRREKIDCVIDLLASPRSAFLTYFSGARIRIGMDTGRRNWCYTHLLPRVLMKEGKRVKSYTLESNYEVVRMLGLGVRRPAGFDIGLPAAEKEKGWARAFIDGIGGERRLFIGIVPGAVYQAKSWPQQRFVELGARIVGELAATPIILWGPGEEEIARKTASLIEGAVLAPAIGIARLGALISMLALVVGPDSGPKHLAVIQGVPTVTLFGPTDPHIWDPMTERHRALSANVDCSPCRKKECEPNSCLLGISVERVFMEIAGVLALSRGADTGKGACS